MSDEPKRPYYKKPEQPKALVKVEQPSVPNTEVSPSGSRRMVLIGIALSAGTVVGVIVKEYLSH